MKTIYLHGRLKRKFGPSFQFYVDSPREAIRALLSQVKGFYDELQTGCYRVVRGPAAKRQYITEQELFVAFGATNEMHIVPSVMGAGGKGAGFAKVLLGVALIAASVVSAGTAGAALGATWFTVAGAGISYGSVAAFGVALTLAGVSTLLTPVLKAGDYGNREDDKPSFLFNGAVNVTNQGNPVPLVYGRFRVGSVVISTGITSEDV